MLVRTQLDIAYTNGETMYDDTHEVCGQVERCNDTYRVIWWRLSAPGCPVATSSAVMWLMPSYVDGDIEDALIEKAEEDWTNE